MTNAELINEIIDILVNDSENPWRLLQNISDECIWELNPGGTMYKGAQEITTFINTSLAMRGKKPSESKTTNISVLNQLVGDSFLCIEYAHTFSFGKQIPVLGKQAAATSVKHCNLYVLEHGKIARIHEYASSSRWWLNLAIHITLSRIWKKTKSQVS